VISFFQMEVSAGFVGAASTSAGFGFRRKVISFFQIDVSSRPATSTPRQP
jgi:hypothetical protein